MVSRKNNSSTISYEDIHNAQKAKRGRPSKNKKGRPKLTMKQHLTSILNKTGDFLSLPEIYNRMGAETIGDKAGIRGILNRSVINKDGEFVRKGRSTGLYKTTKAA